MSHAYERLADAGLAYGPAFRCLRAAWREGNDVLVDVVSDDDRDPSAQHYALDPVLLDAGLHPMMLDGETGVDPRIPFSWSGVALHQPGTQVLRARLTRVDDGVVGLSAVNADGQAVVSVAALAVRPVDARQLAAVPGPLLAMRWVEIADGAPADIEAPAAVTLGGGEAIAELEELLQAEAVPRVVLAHVASPADADVARAARMVLADGLAFVQRWLADERLGDARLVVATRNAVVVRSADVPQLALAPLWGLLRSVQAEHPDRVVVVDIDADVAGDSWLRAALAADEAQLAVREGVILAPRLVRLPNADVTDSGRVLEGTVLVTGATGGLGAHVARHLARRGARRMVLVSRRGPEAEGIADLVAELTDAGCRADVVACDVADRDELAAVMADAGPVTTVVHAAGVLDDALTMTLKTASLDAVLRPKLDAALLLHELAPDAELILFSSVAAAIGSPGQAAYAAANAFLDALAQLRRAQGQPGCAIAWGLWGSGGMGATLDGRDHRRVSRAGVRALTPERALSMLDRARGQADSAVVAVTLDAAALRERARAGTLPAVLRDLVAVAVTPAGVERGALLQRLAHVSGEGRRTVVLEEVRTCVAGVLGHIDGGAVNPQLSFKELGLDSLGAVELRNHLARSTGLRLPPALVYDYPTPVALAEHLVDSIGVHDHLADDLDRMDALIGVITVDSEARGRLAARLHTLDARLQTVLAAPVDVAQGDADLERATDDEIFELIDAEFGEA